MDDLELKEWYLKFDKFKNDIIYDNRYFYQGDILIDIKNLLADLSSTLDSGTILYRSRVYSNDDYLYDPTKLNDNKDYPDTTEGMIEKLTDTMMYSAMRNRSESGFWGYEEEGSFIPPKTLHVEGGRANPKYIRYLYTAEDKYTSLAELRPSMKESISIASIRVEEPVSFIDLTFTNWHEDHAMAPLWFFLISLFSEPVSNNQEHYIVTQYISEMIRDMGYDALRFNSSLSYGKNITVFNYEKCKAISSEVYEVNKAEYEATMIRGTSGEGIGSRLL